MVPATSKQRTKNLTTAGKGEFLLQGNSPLGGGGVLVGLDGGFLGCVDSGRPSGCWCKGRGIVVVI